MGKSGTPGRPKQQHRIKILHPKSRKAAKVTGACMRKERVQRTHTGTALKQSLLLDKLQWFKDNRDTSKDSYTKSDMVELVKRYIQRFDEELEQIEIIHGMKSRKNRQHAAREDIIRMTIQREEQAFKTSGIEMPDLSDTKNLQLFLEWDGTSKHAHLIKLRRVKLADASMNTKEQATEKDASKDVKSDEGSDGGSDLDNGANNADDVEERTDSMDIDLKTDS